MQSQPPRQVEPVVDGPADQCVGEGVAIGRRVRRDQPRGQHVVQRRERGVVREPGGRADRLVEERALDPRCGVERPVRAADRRRRRRAMTCRTPSGTTASGSTAAVVRRRPRRALRPRGGGPRPHGRRTGCRRLGPHRGHEVGRERSTRGRGQPLLDPPAGRARPAGARLHSVSLRSAPNASANTSHPRPAGTSQRRGAVDPPRCARCAERGHGAVVLVGHRRAAAAATDPARRTRRIAPMFIETNGASGQDGEVHRPDPIDPPRQQSDLV